jgi:HSP20 family protein
MNLIKFNQCVPGVSFDNFFDDLFNRSISDFVGSDFVMNQVSVNVIENDSAFIIEAAIPGLKKEDISLAVEQNQLKISADIEDEKKVEEGSYSRREFNFSKISRSFELPESVNTDEITASYVDGVVYITLPKKETIIEKESGKVIQIS